MNRPQDRIPEDKAQDVFTRAAQLYAQHNQSYSVQELMEAGAEAKIPPEFIQQAVEQLQIEQSSTQPPAKRHNASWIGLAIGLPLLVGLGLTGWFFTKNSATTAQIDSGAVESVNPNSTQVSDANLGAIPFKCEGLDLTGEDLRGENFQNADCTGAQLAGANLSGVNIESANLSGANLKGANLRGANLKNANLTEANLEEANLNGANLQDANLSKAQLQDATLSQAKLIQTNLAQADLEGANIDVRGAKAERVNFNNATLPDGTRHP